MAQYTQRAPAWAIAMQDLQAGVKRDREDKQRAEEMAIKERQIGMQQQQIEAASQARQQTRADTLEQRKIQNERYAAQDKEQAEQRKWVRDQQQAEIDREKQTRMSDASYLLQRMGVGPGTDPAQAINFALKMRWAADLSPEARAHIHSRLDEDEEWGRLDQQLEQWSTPMQGADGAQSNGALSQEQAQMLRGMRASGARPSTIMGAAQRLAEQNTKQEVFDQHSAQSIANLRETVANLPLGPARAYAEQRLSLLEKGAVRWGSEAERNKDVEEIYGVAQGWREVPGTTTAKAATTDPYVKAAYEKMIDAAFDPTVVDPKAQTAAIDRVNEFAKANGIQVVLPGGSQQDVVNPADEPSQPGAMQSWLMDKFSPVPLTGGTSNAAQTTMMNGSGAAPQSPANRSAFAAKVADAAKKTPGLTDETFLDLLEKIAGEMGIDPASIDDTEKQRIIDLYEGR